LARLDEASLQIAEALTAKPDEALTLVIEGGVEIVLPLSGLVDAAAEQARLEKEAAALEQRLTAARNTLANPNFVSKAPPPVVERERAKLADLEAQAAKIAARLAGLG